MRINTNLETQEVLSQKVKQLPTDKVPIIIAGGSFNKKGRYTEVTPEGKELLKQLLSKVDANKAYFVIGHKMQGYEKEIVELNKDMNKHFEINAIVPKMISQTDSDNILQENIDGVSISIESDEMGIYKSFNYEIFERRNSVVMAFDGNSPVSNLIQEAKNGKGKAKIYVNEDSPSLFDKAISLNGYAIPFKTNQNIIDKIIEDNPEIM